MDQTPGANPPPTTDTPNTSDQPTTPPVTPPVGETPASDTSATPPISDPAPAGPPPVSDTPATPAPSTDTPTTTETPAEVPAASDTPAAPTTETPTEHPTDTPAPSETPTTPATDSPAPAPTETAAATTPATDANPAASTPSSDTSPATPADPPAHDDKKGMSKPIMVTAGLLIVGAVSAVMLVANMHPGDTQSSAKTPTRPPALPTQASQKAQEAVTTDPNLTINTPQQNATVTTSEVVVNGKTFPNAEVFVDEQELKANPGGVFTTKVALDEGENTIVVSANDEDGNVAEQELTVTYEMEE